MSVCTSAMVAAKSAVSAPMHRDDLERRRAQSTKSDVQAGDHVDAGGHHRRGVDQRRDRRRAGHGVGQPDVERDLRRLAGGADEQQQRRPRSRSPARGSARARSMWATSRLSDAVRCPARLQNSRKMPSRKPDVADAVDDERLLAGVGVGRRPRTRSRSAGRSRGRRPPSRRTAPSRLSPSTSSSIENDEEVQVGEEARARRRRACM